MTEEKALDGTRFDRSICIAVDIEGYSKRLESEQEELQSTLGRLMATAGAGAALDVEQWDVQPQGDGQLILAPLDNTEPRYVDDLVRHLSAGLDRHNRRLLGEARIRLRLALHQGVAFPGSNGFIGDAAVLACRLLDSRVCKDALALSRTDLVLIISDAVYADNVLAERTTFSPGDFAPVTVDEEKATAEAWMWAPSGRIAETLREARSRRITAGREGRAATIQRADTITNNHVDEIRDVDTIYFGTVVRPRDDRDD